MKKLDKYRGCLIGGAIGDALGYPVEFLTAQEIFNIYGNKGINEYELNDVIALISDDTQMTLFTATGLLLGTTRMMMRGIMGPYSSYVYLCYQDWSKTQTNKYSISDEFKYSWLVNIPELFNNRAPGITCINALQDGIKGTIDSPINDSKGCGGIMRVAPVGLYFNWENIEEIDLIGAEIAALTHGHELGYIPAAGLVHIINLITHNDDVSLLDVVLDMKRVMNTMFINAIHINEFNQIIDKAIKLSKENYNDLEAIKSIGEGWIAEETLAIAIYCSLKYSSDFEKAIIASVNHDGDSDSTGAVTGNILGTYLGLKKIPSKYLNNLELKNVILEIADDLYNDCQISEYESYQDEVWENKYMRMSYKL